MDNQETGVEFEVVARDGEVAITMFDDNDDLEVIVISAEGAWILAGSLAEAAQEAEESL